MFFKEKEINGDEMQVLIFKITNELRQKASEDGVLKECVIWKYIKDNSQLLSDTDVNLNDLCEKVKDTLILKGYTIE